MGPVQSPKLSFVPSNICYYVTPAAVEILVKEFIQRSAGFLPIYVCGCCNKFPSNIQNSLFTKFTTKVKPKLYTKGIVLYNFCVLRYKNP